MRNRRTFSSSFKQKAIKIVQEGDRTTSEIAYDLSLNLSLLYIWKRKLLIERKFILELV